MCAEAVGGAVAGLLAAPLYGVGSDWLKRLLPWVKRSEYPVGPSGVLVDLESEKRNKSGYSSRRTTDSAGSPTGTQRLKTLVRAPPQAIVKHQAC